MVDILPMRLPVTTAAGIPAAITNTMAAVALGVGIESILPAFNEEKSLTEQAFETCVQLGLNGVVLAYYGSEYSRSDVTGGLPFSWGLFESQPCLGKRVRLLSALARKKVSATVLQTASRVQVEA